METLAKDEKQTPVKASAKDTAPPDRHDEIDELMRVKRSHRIGGSHVPCPSCTVPVEITVNRCPFCESDIAPETALARETTRRLRELSGELDQEHAARPTEEGPHRRGFFERLKYLFAGDPEPVAPPTVDPHAKRLLSNVSPGDTLKVLDEDGSWLKVKSAGGDIGWVFSTVRKAR